MVARRQNDSPVEAPRFIRPNITVGMRSWMVIGNKTYNCMDSYLEVDGQGGGRKACFVSEDYVSTRP